jgi:hypothetical protein
MRAYHSTVVLDRMLLADRELLILQLLLDTGISMMQSGVTFPLEWNLQHVFRLRFHRHGNTVLGN